MNVLSRVDEMLSTHALSACFPFLLLVPGALD